jgi:hypothetical protein
MTESVHKRAFLTALTDAFAVLGDLSIETHQANPKIQETLDNVDSLMGAVVKAPDDLNFEDPLLDLKTLFAKQNFDARQFLAHAIEIMSPTRFDGTLTKREREGHTQTVAELRKAQAILEADVGSP